VNLTPAGSFEAVSSKVKGEANRTKDGGVEAKKLSVLIQSLKTDIDLRDEHLWKHLKSNQHPKAIITDVKGKDGKATGFLEVAGVKKPINLTYEAKENTLLAHFKVNAADFKLDKAQYMGVGVENEVAGDAEVSLK
jgi:polyisoprenoid-binding protein YceI